MAMTRRRTVTPEGCTREELLSLSPEIRLTEVLLRLYADDHGREKVNSRLMLANFYPLDRGMSESTIDEHLLALDEAGCLVLYDVGGVTFFALTDWPRVDRAADSRFPEPPFASASRTPRDSFVAGEREREGGREGESGPARIDRDQPPSPFCPTHRETGGTDQPCRSCGRHRMIRKVYDDEKFSMQRGEDDESL